MNCICFIAALVALSEGLVQAFCLLPIFHSSVKQHQHRHEIRTHPFSIRLANNIVDDSISPVENNTSLASSDSVEEAARLKRELYQLAASYDRGFSATSRARTEANEIIEKLSVLNPTKEASKGIDGNDYSKDDVPLKAVWRMIWTSALDVVSLGASPFAAPSAIYQVITNPPIAINIIDFIPRVQTFFPSSITPPSLLRAKVATRASSRQGNANRVGLVFEGVELQPIELLGQKVDNLPPLSIDLKWQQNLFDQVAPFVPVLSSKGSSTDDDTDKPGYFDVEYLDDELLVIRQQAPGGVFALVRVDNYDP